jgi:hypothetical protein
MKRPPASVRAANVMNLTAHNRSVYAAGAVAPLASVRRGQSLRSFPRLTSAHFASPGLAAQALILIWQNIVNSRNIVCTNYVY